MVKLKIEQNNESTTAPLRGDFSKKVVVTGKNTDDASHPQKDSARPLSKPPCQPVKSLGKEFHFLPEEAKEVVREKE